MKTCYAHCILRFEVPDDASKEGVKQGFLEVMFDNEMVAEMCNIEFDDEE